MKKINHIILIILVIMSCYSIYYTQTTDNVLVQRAYIGIALIMLNVFFFLQKYSFWVYFQGIILLLGSLDIIAFTATIVKLNTGFSISSFSVEIVLQPISLFLFCVWLVYFIKEIRANLFLK